MEAVFAKTLVETLIKSNDGDICKTLESMRNEIKAELQPQIRAQLIKELTPIVVDQIKTDILTPETVEKIVTQVEKAAAEKQTTQFNDAIVCLATNVKALKTQIEHLEQYVPKAGETEFDETKRHVEVIVEFTNDVLQFGTFYDNYSDTVKNVDETTCEYDSRW